MGRAHTASAAVTAKQRLLSRRQPAPEFVFTGNCPVIQRTGDGISVGRCLHSTYEGHCPSHGDVKRFLGDGADLSGADDKFFPVYALRDFGPPALRKFLGH